MARKKLGEILVEAGVLDTSGLRAALVEQRRWGGPLGRILVDMKMIAEETLVDALARQLNFPTVDLDQLDIAPEVIELVHGELAEQHAVVPFAQTGKFLDVAMGDPTNLGIIDELRIRTQLNVRPHLAGPKAIERAIARFYGRGFASLGADGRGRIPTRAGGTQPPPVRTVSIELEAAPASKPLEVMRAGAEQTAPRRGDEVSLPTPPRANRDAEIVALQDRISKLEALVQRDEDVLRKLLALLIEKGLATREEILERIK